MEPNLVGDSEEGSRAQRPGVTVQPLEEADRHPAPGAVKAHLKGDSASCWALRSPEAYSSQTRGDGLRPWEQGKGPVQAPQMLGQVHPTMGPLPCRTIKVEVYDWDRDGSHDFIGEFTTSYRELARGQSQFNIYEVTLLSFAVESECTFLDYIKGGTQINFTVAIDFTASNGNPSQSTSLHYMSPYQLNAYALALTAVGEIIQHYDSDKMFPALGFGAKLPPDGRVSHEFPLVGDAYGSLISPSLGLLPQTPARPGQVQREPRVGEAQEHGCPYWVFSLYKGLPPQLALLVAHAAKLPMSIIIIGVGQAEFDAMVELDGDDVRISSRGKLAERDIVQFVPFRDYVDRTGNHVLSMARLARDVLAEIPDQLVSYMKSQGIRPRPPPAAPEPSPPQSPARTPPASPLHTHI
ncbi:copine-5-like [Puma concolor]|uniref:Copine-5-like n=1 Tax=Puma concolor TaxID=9696 RepID=A0A6P6I1W6_PUMCO|nr:copine-5-like [Puma concolor]